MQFLHITPEQLLLDSFRLGRKVYESGFRPKYSLSVWRGGTQVGLGANAFFRNRGVQVNHSTIATESYTGPGNAKEVIVKGLEHLVNVVCREDPLLIVDDVYERGETVHAIVKTIREQARANTPERIMVATIHRKPGRVAWEGVEAVSLYDLPDDTWIDYPHELADLVDGQAGDPLLFQKSEEAWNLLQQPRFAQEDIQSPLPYLYITPRELLLDSFKLGVNIFDSGYRPDFLIAMWPGGISVGLPVHEVFKFKAKKSGTKTKLPDHISLNTVHSFTYNQREILGLEYLARRINREDEILIIDSTFKGGKLVNRAFEEMKRVLRRNLGDNKVKVASLFWNPKDESTWSSIPAFEKPDFYLKTVNVPVVYPHNVHRLHDPVTELAQRNPELHRILYT
jgi:hypoxanthine phosphoribosyltransferase